ncbi:MAG TPA: M23 family metallopeptidase [Gemmatimonadaceae bacterium]|nr:M23 family metallopeptidase [Gemmatimonadaceae bacterium]
MPRHVLSVTLFAATVLGARALGAQDARLAFRPAKPAPGGLVAITVAGADVPGDSLVAIHGTMAGEPLHFVADKGGYRAIGAVPVDSTTSVTTIVVILDRASGFCDTLRASVEPPPLPPPSEKLAVAPRFGQPMDSALAARVEAESERARAIGRRSHGVPRLWSAAFQKPRPSAVTSRFGTGRLFNGQVTSRHLGVDFRGASGEPVLAANRGVVALVDTTYLGGRVVYVDHGEGIVTAYMHLSRALVSAGDTVARGQRVGFVGMTGRVTGPHLHWGARYGALTINPLDLLDVAAPVPRPAPR